MMRDAWRADSARRLGVTRLILFNFRLGAFLYQKGPERTVAEDCLMVLLRLLRALSERMIGFYLPFRAHVGEDLVLPHSLHGVFITQRCTIGTNVTIYHNVTIGSDFLSKRESKRGGPTIGSRVVIGTGAILLGNIRVGDGARIGAGAVVTHDVPANGVVYAPTVSVGGVS